MPTLVQFDFPMRGPWGEEMSTAFGDLASIIGDFDGIVIRSATTLDAPMIERAGRLKVIGRAGVGIDNVDVDAATRRGIVVANAPHGAQFRIVLPRARAEAA